jgi:hypothetical protein
MNFKNGESYKGIRVCHICNRAVKRQDRLSRASGAKWVDNPRHDPMYKSLWLCKRHYTQINSIMWATYRRWVAEARQSVDRIGAKKISSKEFVEPIENGSTR